MRILLLLLLFTTLGFGQTNEYHISFDNAVHHEAVIKVDFPDLSSDTLVVRMSRTSPGRYALHEFAKNIYSLKATDSQGRSLQVTRPDPYSWSITGHDGTVQVQYTLFGNRGDGTYTQIDNTHAHLNIPATFLYAESLKERPIEVTFDIENHPNWKIATQLKPVNDFTYYAPDLYYFMDSPTEISDFDIRQFDINDQTIRFALHHLGTEEELNSYFEKVKKIVKQQKEVFGELPEFDFGEYTFLACYMPQVSGDGMEHRNSTVLTSSTGLGEGGMKGNIGTVSHEFFHAWNVERIRPQSLEPFDFTEANMSGALWFAEGFTSYYTGLILVRSGIITPEEYVESLNSTFNYVWNSPALKYFNPIEMSYQAPFVDAATSVDPVNRTNTFISYYSYGSILGLALDLKLREKRLDLDGFMQIMWETYGEPEIPYTLKDLEHKLGEYAGKDLSHQFFEQYIRNSNMPDYQELFKNVGLRIEKNSKKPFFGPAVNKNQSGVVIRSNPKENTPAYKAGLDAGDIILSANGEEVKDQDTWNAIVEKQEIGDKLHLEIQRYGEKLEKTVILEKDPTYIISINQTAPKKTVEARKRWLSQ